MDARPREVSFSFGNVTLHPTDMLSDIFTTKGG